jgi:hypothetical protein
VSPGDPKFNVSSLTGCSCSSSARNGRNGDEGNELDQYNDPESGQECARGLQNYTRFYGKRVLATQSLEHRACGEQRSTNAERPKPNRSWNKGSPSGGCPCNRVTTVLDSNEEDEKANDTGGKPEQEETFTPLAGENNKKARVADDSCCGYNKPGDECH